MAVANRNAFFMNLDSESRSACRGKDLAKTMPVQKSYKGMLLDLLVGLSFQNVSQKGVDSDLPDKK